MTRLLDPTARAALGVAARAQARGRVPSLVAAVTRDGAPVWCEGRGTAVGPGWEAGQRPGADTQYKIGSVTKTMTAALVMLARERGDVALDDPVGRFLPEGPFADATLRSLLSHTAGITAEPHGSWWERSEGGDRAGLVAAHRDAARVLETGSRHHYSNLGYGVLGEVVAEVAGMPWADALTEQVLAPLGLARTTYRAAAPHASGYAVDALTGELVAEPHPDTGAMAAAGQLWSTAGDLATWLAALVDPDRSVLSAASLVAMRTPQSATPEDRSGSGYGLGLSTTSGGGRLLVGHGGSMPGFSCGVLVDVDSGTGAMVLTNGAYGLGGATEELLRTVLDLEPPLPREWTPTTSVPDPVREVVGTWYWGHAPSVVRWDGERLRVGPTDGPGRVMAFAPLADPAGPSGPAGSAGQGAFVGTEGYLTGEVLRPVRDADGALTHLECATFVWTRVPYDARAPIPGRPPVPRSGGSGEVDG